jgi:hypothetical protein
MENYMEKTNHHFEEIKKDFEGQQEIMSKIYDNGFENYSSSISDLPEAFINHDHCMRCMDEGTPGGLHSAGSGILRNEEEVLEAFKKAGVKEISSHDGCGAAGLFVKAKGLDSSNSDEYGKEWAKNIAEKLGVPYKHISYSEMNRPSDHHVSRVAYYDGTGKFDYSKVKELPTGFIISRGIQRMVDSTAEAEVAFKIATGAHGFGDLITEENPFIVCVIADNEVELANLKSELADLEYAFGKKILIDGFLKPQEI